MPDISRRVDRARRDLSSRAHERWRALQPALTPSAGGVERRARSSRADAAARAASPRATTGAGLSVGEVTPEQRMNYSERRRLRTVFASASYRELRVAAERQIGATLDFVDLPPDEQARKAGRSVARIVTMPGRGLVPRGIATGFLVAPDLLLTNHHVFRTRDEARDNAAQFLYERGAGGVREGVTFALDPDRFFINHKGFDYAVVAVKSSAIDGRPLRDFRYLPLAAVTGKIKKGDPVSIIQHPEGGPKQYATTNNRLLDVSEAGFLLYETDTAEGSSGSPVFSENWEAIGLHHCGVPLMRDGKLVTKAGRLVPADDEDVEDSELVWVANEGIRVSALVASFEEQRPDRPDEQRILRSLIQCTRDPLRLVVEGSPLVAGDAGADDTRGADDDRGADGARALTAPATLTLPAEEDDMAARSVFHFTGPVTIHVGGATRVTNGEVQVALGKPGANGPQGEFDEKALKFDEDYGARSKRGYKSAFLDGWKIPAPTLTASHPGKPLKTSSGKLWVIPYYHYSLVMNRDRRMLSWAASNVDYSEAARKHTRTRKQYGGENWRLDPRVALRAPGLQIEDRHFYKPATAIDRGHIVRREDGCWGATANEAEYGNSDTYHWTNCTPQSIAFNQSKEDGLWGKFENHIEKAVSAVGGRVNVFAGPVLNSKDPKKAFDGQAAIQVPMEFWKVVTCVAREGAKRTRLAYGFVFDQTDAIRDRGYEDLDVGDFVVYQMPIAEITKKTGVAFHASVRAADVMKGGGGLEDVRGFRGKRVQALEEIVLR